jgi:hypothetical protein
MSRETLHEWQPNLSIPARFVRMFKCVNEQHCQLLRLCSVCDRLMMNFGALMERC